MNQEKRKDDKTKRKLGKRGKDRGRQRIGNQINVRLVKKWKGTQISQSTLKIQGKYEIL